MSTVFRAILLSISVWAGFSLAESAYDYEQAHNITSPQALIAAMRCQSGNLGACIVAAAEGVK